MTVRGFNDSPEPAAAAATRVKVCGVRDVATAAVCAEAGVDAVGLVFVAASPRAVTAEQAAPITRSLRGFGLHAPTAVGLFCDHPIADVKAAAGAAGITTVQLHGRETPDDVAALADAGLTVWKAVPFAPDRLARWAHVRGLAALLVDAPPPPQPGAGADRGALTGGHGAVFDWHALAALDLTALPPMWLAGGLTPDNVAEAIRVVRPYGVDVSSGVEAERGVKSASAVRAFVQAAKNA